MKKMLFFCCLLSCMAMAAPLSPAAKPAPTDTVKSQSLSLDVKDADVRDVIRTISTGYNLNIMVDKEIVGKVTFHWTNVPVFEGLSQIAAQLGASVVREGTVWRIGKAPEEKRSLIQNVRGRLTVDVKNFDVRDFINEVSARSGVSIVADNKLTGTVTGKLYDVSVDDGLKAMLEPNGFTVTKRRNIYRIANGDNASGQAGTAQPVYGGMGASRGRSGGNSTGFYVDFSNGKLSIDVSNGNLEDVIKAIAEQSDMEIVTYGMLNGTVNAKLADQPLNEALALLLGGTEFTFIQKENIILVGNRNPGTPAGQALSKSELVPLRHIKADIVPQMLPKNILPNTITVVKEQNALLVSGTSEDIVKIREFLKTVDIPTPQVLMDVLVVEFNRSLERDMGFSMGRDGKARTGSSFTFPYLQVTGRNVLAQEVFEKLKLGGSIGKLADDFFFNIKFLERQQKAKILAQPSITVLNGNKASINVGQTQYYKVVSGTEQSPLLQFKPITFGIDLSITPWISRGGQITAELTPVISNQVGTSKDEYPNVLQRSVSTTVRIDNGQTLALGGLIRSENPLSQEKVPILGDLPFIGFLFRTSSNSNTQTNLVIYITPHILPDSSSINIRDELEKLEKSQESLFFREEKMGQALDRSPLGRHVRAQPASTPVDTTSAVPDSTQTQVPILPKPQRIFSGGETSTDTIVPARNN